jgi:hypothetical protein
MQNYHASDVLVVLLLLGEKVSRRDARSPKTEHTSFRACIETAFVLLG